MNINLEIAVAEFVSAAHRGLLNPHDPNFENDVRGIFMKNMHDEVSLTGKIIEVGDLEHLQNSDMPEPSGMVILISREQLKQCPVGFFEKDVRIFL